MWSYAELTRAAIRAAEEGAHDWGNGIWFPAGEPFRALRGLLPRWFPRVNEIIRELGSHNLLAGPTASLRRDPALGPLIDRYLRGAGDVRAEERVRIFRLAWDFAGSALGSRGEQYERFYIGSSGRSLQRAHTMASPDRARRLVDRFVKEELT
jgi:aromatic ring hydroxylase